MGGAGADSLYSNVSSMYTLNSAYGYVTMDGGTGNDKLYSVDGHVSLSGGSGDDSLYASGSGYSTLYGGYGNDTLYGSGGNNVYQFGNYDGNNVITYYSTTDTLNLTGASSSYSVSDYTSGSDRIINTGSTYITLRGGANKSINARTIDGTVFTIGPNTIPPTTPGPGDDIISNTSSYVLILAYEGNDSVYNTGNYVTIRGAQGRDTIYNNDGNNSRIFGGGAADSIYNYNSNNVTVDAGNGNDIITNSSSYKTSLFGGGGDDVIINRNASSSASSASTLHGGAGDDTLTGDTSNPDVFKFGTDDGEDLITNYGTNDTLYLTGIYSKDEVNASISGSAEVINIGETYITLQNAASKNVTAKLDDGTLLSISGSSVTTMRPIGGTIEGTAADDYITNTSDRAVVLAYAGHDSIYNTGNYVTIRGAQGRDTIYNNNGDNSRIFTGGAADSIYNYDGDGVTIDAGNGNDTITNVYSYRASVNGGGGDDVIVNRRGSSSASSASTLYGGAGDDTLTGDSSNPDVFQFGNSDGEDVITNYSSNDTISLTGISYLSAASYYNVGNDKVISLSSEGSITLTDAAYTNITVKLAGGSTSTIYSGSSNSSDERWFMEGDDNFTTSEVSTILESDQSFSTKDTSAEVLQGDAAFQGDALYSSSVQDYSFSNTKKNK